MGTLLIPFGASRLFVFAVGSAAFLAIGDQSLHFDWGLSRVGDVLTAPSLRYDADWYLRVANDGYAGDGVLAARFPLYPLLTAAVGALVGSLVAGGILVSLAAFGVALLVLGKLATADIGAAAAKRAVYILAFSPMAFFFSAIYTEALFLALSVGCMYAARLGHWKSAGTLGALTAVTRNTGFLMVIPVAILYLYGPRADRRVEAREKGLRPRYPVRWDALWILAVPAGIAPFCGYCWATFGDPFAGWNAQEFWGRHFQGPLAAIWYGGKDAIRAGAHFLLGDHGDSAVTALGDLFAFGVLLFAIAALVGVFRRLPLAYGVYMSVAVVPPLSAFSTKFPLASFPRYFTVLFPVAMWLAMIGDTRRRLSWILGISIALLGYFTLRFSTGHWVA